MNKLSASFIGVLAMALALPAIAGPDWQSIEHAAKQATQVERHDDPYEAAGPTAAGLKCSPDKPRLLLDHGPRAEATPSLNRQRQERYQAALRACEAALR